MDVPRGYHRPDRGFKVSQELRAAAAQALSSPLL
jgi:hypothetical protein